MKNPLVSICVPTCNRAGFLKGSLPTICGQSYEPLEILISDNASADGTEDLCRELQKKDLRVRYLRQPINIGLYPNHNFCIEESRGEYLCLFHDDEVYAPEMIQEYVGFMQAHPEVGLLCSDWELIGEKGEVLAAREFGGPDVLPGEQYIRQTIRSGRSWLNCPGTMIRRSALGSIRFDEGGPTGFGDFVLWFRVAESSCIGHVPRRLWRYRIHNSALCSKSILAITQDYEESVERYLRGFGQRYPERPNWAAARRRELRRYLFWSLAYELLRSIRPSAGKGQTIFDAMGYRLTPEEITLVRRHLKGYQTGLAQSAARLGIELSIRGRLIRPIDWAMRHAPIPWVRTILGLR